MKLRSTSLVVLGLALGLGVAFFVALPMSGRLADAPAPAPAATARKTDSATAPGSIRVSPGFRQNFAVRTADVERRDLPISIRSVGVLAHNEEHVYSVNTKIEGWIESAWINNVGTFVHEGDPLFEIYSPQLVTTQREFLAAVDYVARLQQRGANSEAVERAESLVQSARERLRYWDITAAQIERLAASGAASRTIVFHSPASGFVVEKKGDSLEGMKLDAGMTVLKIADHTTLWAEADFFEEDLRYLREGSEASISVAAFPERRWDGRILFFRSALNADTRALTAFIEVANPDLVLRPKMTVDLTVAMHDLKGVVAVPAEAVLSSGERAVAVVAHVDGAFEPREVTLGVRAGDWQEVTVGLAPGEQVVVSSQFLIDSESNLKAAIGQLLREGEAAPAMSHHHHH